MELGVNWRESCNIHKCVGLLHVALHRPALTPLLTPPHPSSPLLTPPHPSSPLLLNEEPPPLDVTQELATKHPLALAPGPGSWLAGPGSWPWTLTQLCLASQPISPWQVVELGVN